MFGQLVGRERGRWTLLPTADVANNYNYMCYGGTLIPFVARAISRHSSTTIQLNYHLIFFYFYLEFPYIVLIFVRTWVMYSDIVLTTHPCLILLHLYYHYILLKYLLF